MDAGFRRHNGELGQKSLCFRPGNENSRLGFHTPRHPGRKCIGICGKMEFQDNHIRYTLVPLVRRRLSIAKPGALC